VPEADALSSFDIARSNNTHEVAQKIAPKSRVV